ncbi:MAG: glutamine--fructose-6-phosphate transaminase (isomerizing) [Desulfohalobiaceae bacterium]|nr:glutamine--fructose-6-phosphate transaminase (isomerizing) [Desulfohalobiaceae bacterium]
MCGIIAYSGHRPVVPILLDGLKRLEYRGYDSAGVAYAHKGSLAVVKQAGKMHQLEEMLEGRQNGATSGIGHTRWATHGLPNRNNAHPHTDNGKGLALVHNGIIENHQTLKTWLEDRGHRFTSETDTEVLSHLISQGCLQKKEKFEALAWALDQVEGSYAIAVIFQDEPGVIWAARQSSPLLMGLGEGEMFLSSDIPAFLSATRDVVYLDDGELVRMEPGGWQVFDSGSRNPKAKEVSRIDWDIRAAEKGGYPHFMLKEIFEQPGVIQDCLKGRIDQDKAQVLLPEVEGLPVPERLRIVACGTSYHAGLWAKHLFEHWSDIDVEVDIASEFRYRKLRFRPNDMTLAITQSGETADTLAGLRMARESQVPVLGLCNVVGSSVARESDRVLYTQAGPEISVASTKAMCSQMTSLLLLALYWGRRRGTTDESLERTVVTHLRALPGVLEASLPGMQRTAQDLVQRYRESRHFFYLGRGLNASLALEGALKLKEISYIHAEGYAAGEMKHGPIALIDPAFPTFVVAPADDLAPKTLSNIKEVLARKGEVILLSSPSLKFFGTYRWDIPELVWPLSSFAVLPALQLFAYEMAVELGTDVDQPRNLAKSVTVE